MVKLTSQNVIIKTKRQSSITISRKKTDPKNNPQCPDWSTCHGRETDTTRLCRGVNLAELPSDHALGDRIPFARIEKIIIENKR